VNTCLALKCLSIGEVLEIVTLAVLYGFIVVFTGKLQFFLAPVAFLFVLTFALGRGQISKLMATKPLLYLGKISYSLYLTHFLISIVMNVFAERAMPGILGSNWNATGLGGDLLLLPYLAVVIGISHWTYHHIERPGQKAILDWSLSKRLKRWFKRPSLT
jgi:peptidoglycan/LPS O-acetylase OafA/YrhL